MALPFWMLGDLKITMPQKLGLAIIFSVAIVCIALDIVRVVEAISQNQALYTVIEINLVVVISCLPTYRTLIGVRKRKRSRQSHSWRSLERGKYSRSPDGDNHPLRTAKFSEIEMSARSIQVTQDVEISNVAGEFNPLDPPDPPNKPGVAAVRPNAYTAVI